MGVRVNPSAAGSGTGFGEVGEAVVFLCLDFLMPAVGKKWFVLIN